MNILVVDDDVLQVRTLGRGLRLKGYQVSEAFTAERAMERINDRIGVKIDLVLVDYLMPGINGLQLLSDICGKYPNLPTILTTSLVWNRDRLIKAMYGRCNGYLEKPFTLDQLMREIQRVTKPMARVGYSLPD